MVSLFFIMLKNRSLFSSFNNTWHLEADKKYVVLHMKTQYIRLRRYADKSHMLQKKNW